MSSPSKLRRRDGFSLAELLVGIAIAVIIGGIAYGLLGAAMTLYIQNLSLNKSDNSLRVTMQRLKRDVTLATATPQLVTYDPAKTPAVLIAAPVGTTTAQGVRIMVNLGPAYSLLPTTATSDVPPTSTSTAPITSSVNQLKYRLARCTSNGALPTPVASTDIRHSDRLVFLDPSPIPSQNVTETNGSYSVVTAKPGRRLVNVTPVSNTFVDVTVEDLSGSGQAIPAVTLYNSAYVVHEVAYVAYGYVDATGNSIRELRYFPDAEDARNYTVICRDLDPSPQEKVGGATVQPFTLVNSPSGTSLNVNFPVRAVDYAHAIAERNVPPGQINNSSEFNVFISAKPQVSPRINLFTISSN